MKKKKDDILVPRMGKTIWKKLNPDHYPEEWMWDQDPNCFSAYVDRYLEGNVDRVDPDTRIKVVTITSEYLKWLEKLGVEHGDAALYVYMDHIDDQKADRLLKRSKLNKDRYVMALPLIVKFIPAFNGTLLSNYSLDEELCEKLETELEKFYPDCQITVPGGIYRAADIRRSMPDYWFDEFCDQTEWRFDFDSYQEYDSPFLPLAILYVPFILEYRHERAVFTIEELENSNEFNMNRFDIGKVQGFEKTASGIDDILNESNCFEESEVTMIADIPCYSDAYSHERFWLETVYRDFVESMGDMMESELEALGLLNEPNKYRA